MTNGNEKNRIGYRYLFDSKGCSLSSREEAKINLIVSEKYDVQIYFGPKPQHGIQSESNCSKYFIPGEPASFGTVEFKKNADQSSKYGPFFLEIVVSTEANEIVSDNGAIRDLLLKQSEGRRGEFKNIINLVAGIIGLRFHRQFILELIGENVLAWEGEVPAFEYAGTALEILERLPLNDNGIKHLEVIGKKLKTLPYEDMQEYSLIFHWLLRAWHERDILYNFIDLFIPLECVLNMLSNAKISIEDKHKAKTIRASIRKHTGENSKDLLHFFNKLFERLRPTLEEAFIELAQTAKFPGWENDIEAFRNFKRMRNDLFHGRSKDVQHKLSISNKKESREFSDLVERYVNYFFFKDNKVYRSRWRPEIREKDNNENN
ncbi:MAG: hypothetical protein A2167_02130 [Planctomycetes bacterium RBG_13_46_10]|nr:MAG: hypothetical protein A2167_02130 [Planctomycetes bacterium RBG_13_46_10]